MSEGLMPELNDTVEFHKIPPAFVETYRRELLDWAANFRSIGPVLELKLLRVPGDSVLDLGFVERATVMCEPRQESADKVKLVISPASGFDIEIIQQHTDRLPQIRAARAVAARRWANSNVPVAVVFERIPDAFLVHYQTQFQTWGAEFKDRGRRCAIRLERAPGEKPQKDEEGRDIMEGVWFDATVDYENPAAPKLVVRPASAFAEEQIEKHLRKMKPHWND
jgi:hypothetical protein